MLLTIKEFCSFIDRDISGFVKELAKISRVVSTHEENAWMQSFPAVSAMLTCAIKQQPSIAYAHVSTSNLVLEYKLPSASAWCDLVVMGQNMLGEKHVVVIELKNWYKDAQDEPGSIEGLIWHNGREKQHPSDQVKGYTEYCRRFHSTVQEESASISGCVFFTQAIDTAPYLQVPNAKLVKEYPIFNTNNKEELSAYLTVRVAKQDLEFSKRFLKGYYKQDRNILVQVAKNLSSHAESPFVLLDKQRVGFNLVKERLKNRLQDKKKQVIIVDGPPGSGKSALAINLWFDSVLTYVHKRPKLDVHNVLFVTTSSSQRTNWEDTFSTFGKDYNARRFIMAANKFNPGISSGTIPDLKRHFSRKGERYITSNGSLAKPYWKEYIDYIEREKGNLNYFPNQHFISLVDEAHALIDPTIDNYKTNKHAGWVQQAGPQAWHIINASQVSVFFMDSKQSYRDNETTSFAAIKSFATELDAAVEVISLNDMQFRCGGSKDYVDWLESLFREKPLLNIQKWKDQFHFEIVDYPHVLDEKLGAFHKKGKVVRLLSSYTRDWVTKNAKIPHDLPLSDMDFYFNYEANGDKIEYGKIWNYAPKEDYTLFVKAPLDSRMGGDPLCEVGCPYVVRGFDFDYVGLLWLEDLVYRKGKWEVMIDAVKETALSSTIRAARDSGDYDKLLEKVMLGYRILLTRAIKGVFVYCHDKETKEYIQSRLAANGAF